MEWIYRTVREDAGAHGGIPAMPRFGEGQSAQSEFLDGVSAEISGDEKVHIRTAVGDVDDPIACAGDGGEVGGDGCLATLRGR